MRLASPWTESVFHVLAHVDVGPIAASCFAPSYVRWIEERLGPARDRALGEDIAVLSAIAGGEHDLLARAQALAWVFASAEAVGRIADRELSVLRSEDVLDCDALAIAQSAGALSEVLRAAAELELPHLAKLDAPPINRSALERALETVACAAPSLGEQNVSLARPLGLRGRALGRSIVVGVPRIACPDEEHVAWQAAHEATVGEVARVTRSFEDTERRALGLLRSRARAAGLADAHGRWLARLDLSALGPIADVDDPAE